MDDIKAIKELANFRIEEILDALGIDYREKYHSFVGSCHVHGGDRMDAFSWDTDRGGWKCFSHNCDNTYGSDVYGLIRGMKKCTFGEAIKWIKRLINTNLSKEEIKKLKDSRSNKDFIVYARKKKHSIKTYPASCLDRLGKHAYLLGRGFSQETIDRYHIGYCAIPGMFMYNRIVFPCVNFNGEIVGFTGRTADEDWEAKCIPKWKHSLGPWVQYNVFNANGAYEHIKKSGIAIICEGPLDVLRLEEAGVHNAVAILGKELKNGQATAIMNMGCTTLHLALDNDVAGQIGTQKVLKTSSLLFDINVIKLPEDKNDVDELSTVEIREVFCV